VGENKYDPEVEKRLELVRKQFQRNASEQKKQEAAARRQQLFSRWGQNKINLGRWITYTILGIIVLAVIGVLIWQAVSG
jgi:hypothetical protein